MKVLKAVFVLAAIAALVLASSAAVGGDMHGRRVNFAIGPNDGVIQPSPRPIWGSCGGECSNYDGHFPFVTLLPGIPYTLLHWDDVDGAHVAGVITMKKGTAPLTLWFKEGTQLYCNVSEGRDYIMTDGIDCQ